MKNFLDSLAFKVDNVEVYASYQKLLHQAAFRIKFSPQLLVLKWMIWHRIGFLIVDI